jgi:hypothetical protein
VTAKVIMGNHSSVLVRHQDRDRIREFYCDVLSASSSTPGSVLRLETHQAAIRALDCRRSASGGQAVPSSQTRCVLSR